MNDKICKACGKAEPKSGTRCPSCGHSDYCSGCGACQHCPRCGEDKHEGNCKSMIELPHQDILVYMEMARFAMDSTAMNWLQAGMRLSDEEFDRLRQQLDDYLEQSTS